MSMRFDSSEGAPSVHRLAAAGSAGAFPRAVGVKPQLQPRMRVPALAAVALGAALVAGCASTQVAPGSSLADVTQRLGKPSAEYRLTPGERQEPALQVDTGGRAVRRLEYSGGSMGRHTHMYDFDAEGRLLATAQVRTEQRFNAIRPGMSRDQVLRAIGRPSGVMTLAFQKQRIWNYRYESPVCQWFQVGISPEGRVTEAGYGPDPLCTSDEP